MFLVGFNDTQIILLKFCFCFYYVGFESYWCVFTLFIAKKCQNTWEIVLCIQSILRAILDWEAHCKHLE
jgi:hypothetical protein